MKKEVTDQELNEQEFERLQKQYPLLPMELNGYRLTVHTGKNSSYHTTLEQGRLDHLSIAYLDKDHLEASMNKALMTLYPDLYIHVFAGKDGCHATVWVNRPRDGHPDDAESIGDIDILSKDLHETLMDWDAQAYFAKQDGMFFCTGHQSSEPELDFDYFHFAGKYCKQYGKDHSDLRKQALSQNYD